MYDQIYTYPNKDNKPEEEEKIKFGLKDIFAMTIAAYQIIFVPMAIVILGLVILYLLFSLLA